MDRPYYSRVLPCGFEEGLAKLRAGLASEGLTVVSEHDMAARFADKLGVSFPKYMVLSVCNVKVAHRVLTIDRHAGVMMPCTVVVFANAEGTTEMAIANPLLVAKALAIPELEKIADEVLSKVLLMIEHL
ncbi:MAG: DUF302 domain-containing protein [Candidatus Brocadiia bacterium]